MKLYYMAVGLTFVLSFQGSRSQQKPPRSLSSKKEHPVPEEAIIKVCDTEECIKSAVILKTYMNQNISPCGDFYNFACGKFHVEHLPESRIVRLYELNEKITNYLESNNNYNIEAIAKIQYIFRLCMNEDKINEFGDKVIQLQLDNVGLYFVPPFYERINKENDFGWILAKVHKNVGIPFLFSVAVRKDKIDYRKNRLCIELTMSTITYANDSRMAFNKINQQELEKYYKQYLMVVVKYLYQTKGMIISEKQILRHVSYQANEVIQFLMRADKVMKENVHLTRNYEYVTMQELQEKTNEILQNSNIEFSWQEYLLSLFENIYDVEDYFGSGEPLIVKNMKYLESIFEVISGIDENVFEASLWWVTVNDVTNIAYKELRELQMKFFEKATKFSYERKAICLEFVKKKFSYALTHLLLQEVNVKDNRKEIMNMAKYLKISFLEIINNAEWLDESTRKEAIQKLQKLKILISNESWVEDPQEIEKKYEEVKIEPSWYMTQLNEKIRNIENELKLLFIRNQSDEKQFLVDSLNISIKYNYIDNTVAVPFGILGMPFFNHGLRSMDYGGIVFLIGHEFMHAFDNIGRTIDSSGNKRNWWHKNTLQEYENRAECFVKFYSNFYFHGYIIENDGYLTLEENIADNVGIELALRAFDKYIKKYGPEKKLIAFETYSSEQLLTLAMATSLCWNPPDSYFHEENEKKVYSPFPLMVNGMFTNSYRMAEIWSCPVQTPMNSLNKCYIW